MMFHIYLKKIENLITVNSLKNFLGLSTSFFDLEPQLYNTNDNYKMGFNIVQNLKFVNYTTEQSIKLIKGYNSIITKNEYLKQFLLQVTRNYHQKYQYSKKRALLIIYNNLLQSY